MNRIVRSVNMPLPVSLLVELDHAGIHGVTATRLRRWLDLPPTDQTLVYDTLMALARQGVVEHIGNYFWIKEKS
jgi:hypothetical protein